tara:strand:+ start:813 stop:1097 length:285 start_codon:yes stop_codon:yes gene_type:complete
MIFFILAGIFSAVSILFLLFKLDIRKVLAFDIAVDIGSSLLLIVLFAGTFAGMMAAVIGGAIISVVLYAIKRLKGYEKPIRKGFKVKWVNVPPR